MHGEMRHQKIKTNGIFVPWVKGQDERIKRQMCEYPLPRKQFTFLARQRSSPFSSSPHRLVVDGPGCVVQPRTTHGTQPNPVYGDDSREN